MPVTGDAPVVESTRRVVIRHSPRVEVPQETPGTTLFCGAPQPLSAADLDSQEPWRVQFLPIQDAPPPRKRQRLDRPKSNGCGAAVHNAAIPKSAIWHGADANATDVVLPLDDKYVPQVLTTIMKTRREECGCLRNPVGCAVCGNPLVALIVHCTVHTHLESIPSAYEFRVRDTPLLRTFPPRRSTWDDDTTTRSARGRRAWRPTPRAVAMEGEDGADEAALFSAFHAVTRSRPSRTPSAGATAFLAGHTEGVTALSIPYSRLRSPHLLSPPAGELFSYDSFLWTGPSCGFIPGRRAVRPGGF
ncbi:hypothetical protein B0H14DRAFT_3873265 [Mycena olivaceomarginata]|nr:hypothetical protein B0H14DRAFT_3873265 [Mycena olivaceomarginata]